VETLRIREVVVSLAAAGLLIPAVRRLKVNPALGFLLLANLFPGRVSSYFQGRSTNP